MQGQPRSHRHAEAQKNLIPTTQYTSNEPLQILRIYQHLEVRSSSWLHCRRPPSADANTLRRFSAALVRARFDANLPDKWEDAGNVNSLLYIAALVGSSALSDTQA